MRSLVVFAVLGLVVADVSPGQFGECLVDSGEAVSDAMDAALFIWAATKRCGKVGMDLKCEVDIASAIKAVNGMVNVILNSVDKCDGIKSANKACGLEVGKLTKHLAGLTAGAGFTAQKCPVPAPVAPPALGTFASPVQCTVDLKNTLKQLFKAIKHIGRSHEACKKEDKRHCTANVLDIISSIAGMGGYLAGAIGQCKRTTAVNSNAAKADTRTALCTQAIADLVHHTTEVAQSGVELSRKCGAKPPPPPAEPDLVIIKTQAGRLFEQDGNTIASSSANLILGAFLPVTAIVGFVGGRFYANSRVRAEQTREFMSDNE